MKDVKELYTVAEVDERATLIGRHSPGLKARIQGVISSGEELSPEDAACPRAVAMYEALMRRKELEGEIAANIRSREGDLLIGNV